MTDLYDTFNELYRNEVSERHQPNYKEELLFSGEPLGGGAFSDSDGDGTAELRTAHADFEGGNARNIGLLEIEQLATTYQNQRVVRYWPSNPNQFSDIQDAIDALSTHGHLHVAGDVVDVASEGTIDLSAPVTLTGEGWGGGWPKNADGSTEFRNTGSDTVAGPVLSSTGSTGATPQTVFRNFIVNHADTTTPAVEITDSTHNIFENINAICQGDGQDSFHVTGNSYFTTFRSCVADTFTRYGYNLDGAGSQYRLICSNAFGASAGATAGARLDVEKPIVFSGEYNQAESGIHLDTSVSAHNGGILWGTSHESDTVCIRIGTAGGSTWGNAVIFEPQVSFRNLPSTSSVVKFENSSQGKAKITSLRGSTSTNQYVCEWGAGSYNDTLVTTHANVRTDQNDTPLLVDSGATRAHMHIPQALSNFTIGQLPTDPNLTVTVQYSTSENSPVWHDGTDWYSVSGTTFAP